LPAPVGNNHSSLANPVINLPGKGLEWVIRKDWLEAWQRGATALSRRPWYEPSVRIARHASRVALLVAVAFGAWGSFAGVRVRNLESGLTRIHLENFGHFEVARWMNDHLPGRGLLAIGEAGVIPYYTRLPVLDMFGLTDPHIAHLRGSLHRKFDVKYVLDRRPRYVFLLFTENPHEGRVPAHRHGSILLGTERFAEEYVELEDFGSSVLYQRRDTASPAP
jgi:hypothetical protein